MAEKITEIEMKLVEQPVSVRRQSFAHQRVKYSPEHGGSKLLESVNAGERLKTESKSDDEGGNKLKAPFTWYLLEECKYSPHIKRFFRCVAIVNILSLAVNGPAIPAEYLQKKEGFCEDKDVKEIHFIVVLAVDIMLSLLYTMQLLIRLLNSLHWKRLQVFISMPLVASSALGMIIIAHYITTCQYRWE